MIHYGNLYILKPAQMGWVYSPVAIENSPVIDYVPTFTSISIADFPLKR